MATQQASAQNISAPARTGWGWFLFIGIVFLIGGIFAIVLPLVASLAVGILLAVILIVSGALEVIQSFRIKSWGGFLWQLIMGIVVFLGGLAIYIFPAFGAMALTLVVAAAFFVKGIFQIILSMRIRPMDGWGWILTAGIIAILAAIAIMWQYPFSGIWVPGVLAGVSLIFTGWSYIALALAAKRLA